ncbi:MAG: TIGR02301 family protein [Hyphomonadaceae bacterium]|nr:TIGR02301 family protein [Hyphomonadaceae bacterium]
MALRPVRAAALAMMLLCAPAAALAQTRPPPPTETPRDRRVQYGDELRQLAHVLGGAHYLRVLCAGRGDQSWRQYMAGLLDREGGRRRTDLVDAFNAGYRDVEVRFPGCTPGAQAQEVDLKNQGMRLADTLAARHSD